MSQSEPEDGEDSSDGGSQVEADRTENRKQALQEKLGEETLTKRPEGKISFRKTNSIAPNATVAENHFTDAEAMTFVYVEDDDLLYIQPLPEHDETAADEYKVDTDGNSFEVSAMPILRKIGLNDIDKTRRYGCTWDDELLAVEVDLSQDPEVLDVNRKKKKENTED
jgi:hypothetical protein